MSRVSSEALERVRQAYDEKSADFRATDKREKWAYLAAKLLTDHYLLHEVDLADKTVLNIGCAPHPIDEIMYVHRCRKWVASDLNPNVIKANETLCREEMSDRLLARMEWQVADATALPFPDASFDVVVSMSVLEHIPDGRWRIAFREIHRVLRPGGVAVITMSNKLNVPYYLWSRKMQARGCEFGYEECIYPWTMRRCLAEAGLEPQKFISSFWFTPSIWAKFMQIPLLKYFGMRMGYRCRKV
jgi:SAM-dependent methyltransferase